LKLDIEREKRIITTMGKRENFGRVSKRDRAFAWRVKRSEQEDEHGD
jgi:hypothetical protein